MSRPEIESRVHDKRRRTERVSVAHWLDALRSELAEHAAETAQARAELQRLLHP